MKTLSLNRRWSQGHTFSPQVLRSPYSVLFNSCKGTAQGPHLFDAKTQQMILFWLWRSSWLWPCDQVFPHIPGQVGHGYSDHQHHWRSSSHLTSVHLGLVTFLFVKKMDDVCLCAHVHGCSQTRCWIPLELELKPCAALSSQMWELEMECRQLRSHSFQWAISPAPRWSFFPGFFPTFIEYAKGPYSLQWPARTKARAFLQFCKKSC